MKKHKSETLNNEPFREIVKGYLVVRDSGPILLTTESESAVACFKKCKVRDKNAFIIDFTTHVERFKEIGRNLFVPIPVQHKDNFMEYRNKIIKEWQDRVDAISKSNPKIVWNKIASKYNLPHQSAVEFNQWALDHLKYHKRVI
jgi:hypothetical protein